MLNYVKSILSSNIPLKIALLEPHNYPAMAELRNGFFHHLSRLVSYSYPMTFPHNAGGNKEKMGSISKEVAGSGYHLIVSVGTDFTQQIKHEMQAAQNTTPLVFAYVANPAHIGFDEHYAIKDNENMTGVCTFEYRYAERFKTLMMLLPRLKNVLFLYDPRREQGVVESQFQHTARFLAGNGIRSHAYKMNSQSRVTSELSSKIAQHDPDILFTMYDSTVMANMRGIAQVACTTRVPLITADAESVTHGAALSFGNPSYDIGTELAQKAHSILYEGYAARSIPLKLHYKKYIIRVNPLAMLSQGVQLTQKANRWLDKHAEFLYAER